MNRDRREYIKKKLKKYAPSGREMVLCGALMLFIWATSEFVTRWDAMDGLLKVILGWVKQGKLTLGEALKDIFSQPEARKDILTLGYLALTALVSGIGIIIHRFRPALITLIVALAVLAYDPYGAFWKRALSYATLLRLSGAALMALGSGLKLANNIALKRRLGARYDKKHPAGARLRVPPDAHGSSKTLIPERTAARRK